MTWWGRDARDLIGWQPGDGADSFAPQLTGKDQRQSGERALPGSLTYPAMDYSRGEPSPAKLFEK